MKGPGGSGCRCDCRGGADDGARGRRHGAGGPTTLEERQRDLEQELANVLEQLGRVRDASGGG
ncbi:MAG: hypothetical protein M0T72_04790 [Candidatus Dormibacteraeota bacterium]|nr:hypothetical protein [Candidatus Dormibacteraeota bacterium]